MCGICGEIRFNGGIASTETVSLMAEAMASRGPDGSGVHHQNGSALGHRRLKVIDVSERASQPMVDSDLGLGIVYNGAVYNYPDLRAELQSKGYRFFSTGDTEVVLKAYHAWGDRCVERLNGMFAFAIWERDSGRVFLARDRLGIKPLYYAELEDGLRFASSLPALLEGGGIDTEIDAVALHYYMTFHSVVPPPRTILKGVKKLPPSTTLTLETVGRRKQQTYWELSFEADREQSKYGFDDWSRLLLEELEKSVSRRLIADVPVGVLLSGGLDSSLVVGLLANAGQGALNTFSIGFESVAGEEGDEFRYSDVVAERFSTQHHKIEVDASRVFSSLDGCVRAMSEPMVSHDCIGFYLLSEEVARHVKVVQSGQGADEIMAGYYWYPPMMCSSQPVADYARVFFDRDHDEFTRAVNPHYVDGDASRAFLTRYFEQAPATRAIDKALHIDTTVMLVDDPVKRVDNMTMAWGLEARVPFLDHELVELAARIPANLKVENGGKYILKEVARSIIPPEVIDRPKGYFPVPSLKYLRGEYLEYVRRILERPAARQRGIFNPEYVDELLLDPESHVTPLRGSKLWQIALLEYWLQVHNI
ncbi:MAG: N-acetylglutaminylglutamine amidotransferase [Gemmatimonadetes bacterium]|nr:N-acetylglutaminylglutamine amidotransferase [Gemmatimonadota bacterium]